MRHVLTTAAGSADIIYEFALNCSEGTAALVSKRGDLTPAPRSGVQSFSGRMPVTPDDQRPSEPAPGSLEAVAFRTGCAWLRDATASHRGPEQRGMPTMDKTWYPVLHAEGPHDTIYVDSARAHRIARDPSLVSVWVRMTAQTKDSLVIDGKSTAYIMAEEHVRCGDPNAFKLGTVQYLAFDEGNVFLGAVDTPDAPLHPVAEGSREWGVAVVACVQALHHQRSR
jgi:hypothetical protein